jgi:hypothetical protein
MVLGEVGMFPVELEVKSRMLSYCYNIHGQSLSGYDKISCMLYRLCAMQNETTNYALTWLQSVHRLLDQFGLSFFKLSAPLSLTQFKLTIRQRLKDQFLTLWRSDLQEK